MKRIFTDFLSRYRWGLIAGLAYSGIPFPGGSFVGFMFVLGPVLISWERTRGAFTVYRTLPVPRQTLERTLWFMGVMLFPLMYLLWCPAVNLIASAFTSAPLFTGQNAPISIVLTSFMGMGYAALMMLLLPFLPRPGDTNTAWQLRSILGGGLWGLFCGGFFFITQALVTGLEQQEPWYFAALAATPVVLALSYVRSNRVFIAGPVAARRKVEVRPSYSGSRLGFWLAFWAQQVSALLTLLFLVAGMSLVMVLFRYPFGMLLGGGIFLMIFAPMMSATGWFNSMRALRTLPMTSLRLTLFLLAVPAVSVAIAAGFMALLCIGFGMPEMTRYCLMAACVGLAFGFAGCTAIARFGQLAVIPFMVILMISFMLFRQQIALFSPIALAVTFIILKNLIQSSSDLYRQKPFGISR